MKNRQELKELQNKAFEASKEFASNIGDEEGLASVVLLYDADNPGSDMRAHIGATGGVLGALIICTLESTPEVEKLVFNHLKNKYENGK